MDAATTRPFGLNLNQTYNSVRRPQEDITQLAGLSTADARNLFGHDDGGCDQGRFLRAPIATVAAFERLTSSRSPLASRSANAQMLERRLSPHHR